MVGDRSGCWNGLSDTGVASSGWKSAGAGPLIPTLILVLASLPTPALSQAVRGRVMDQTTNIGIEGAIVTLIRSEQASRSTISDSVGDFFIPLPGPGPYALEAGRIGYATSRSRQFTSSLTDTISVEFRLSTEAVLLDPLVVTALDGRGQSRFERHRNEWGRGIFLSPAMVDSIQPTHAADVLRGQEETWLTWTISPRTLKPVPNVRTQLGTGCLAYMIDFFPVLAPRIDTPVRGEPGTRTADAGRTSLWEDTVLEYLKGKDIVAVEFYRSIGEVPPELKDYAYLDWDLSGRGWVSPVSNCGLVIFWTRAGW